MTQCSKKILSVLRKAVTENYMAIFVAVVVGIIYVTPHTSFIMTMGDNYKGIPVTQTANEDFYTSWVYFTPGFLNDSLWTPFT